MELQTWFHTHDYINEFKRNKVSYRKYPTMDLMIIKRPYNSLYDETNFWLNYCRGLIINYKTNEIIFIPPIKSIELDNCKKLDNFKESPLNLVDGTMINLFYYKNQWNLSTRSNIGCNNRWKSNLTFKQLFDECSSDLDLDVLDTTKTYSFVCRHKKNRITSKVNENCLVLVEMYDKLNRLSEFPKNKGYICIHDWVPEKLIKGLTLYSNNKRYKYLSEEHKFIEMIKPNSNDPCFEYLSLRKSGHLTNYLYYFPEKKYKFNKYKKKLYYLTKLIYQLYTNIFIYKTMSKEDIPFCLKPIIYNIHKIYLKEKIAISWARINQFMYNLDIKQIQYVMNQL